MGIRQKFADTQTAQKGNGVIQVTILKDVVEELGIEKGDELLWTSEEDRETATIHAPRRN